MISYQNHMKYELFHMIIESYLQNFIKIYSFLWLWQNAKVYYCHWSKNWNFRPPNVFLADSLPFHAWRFPWFITLIQNMRKFEQNEDEISVQIRTNKTYIKSKNLRTSLKGSTSLFALKLPRFFTRLTYEYLDSIESFLSSCPTF